MSRLATRGAEHLHCPIYTVNAVGVDVCFFNNCMSRCKWSVHLLKQEELSHRQGGKKIGKIYTLILLSSDHGGTFMDDMTS